MGTKKVSNGQTAILKVYLNFKLCYEYDDDKINILASLYMEQITCIDNNYYYTSITVVSQCHCNYRIMQWNLINTKSLSAKFWIKQKLACSRSPLE